jgi:hypothetical protein
LLEGRGIGGIEADLGREGRREREGEGGREWRSALEEEK